MGTGRDCPDGVKYQDTELTENITEQSSPSLSDTNTSRPPTTTSTNVAKDEATDSHSELSISEPTSAPLTEKGSQTFSAHADSSVTVEVDCINATPKQEFRAQFEEMAKLCTQSQPRPRPPITPESTRVGRRKIRFHKYLIYAVVFSANVFFAFAAWFWPAYYYIYLPFIALTPVLNLFIVFNNPLFHLKHRMFPEKITIPDTPESLVMIIPCYNETQEELTAALDSLVDQKNIDDHQKVVMIICDGRARGKGMEKTTAQYLLGDILPMDAGSSRKTIEKAYIAWDQQPMDVTVQKGSYRGMPYCCVVKHQNQGKRDSLIVLRSFLYKYNIRHQRPESIFKPEFFAEMATFLVGAGMDHVDDLIGMDADTVFEDICVSELLKQARLPNTLGVCGLVAVDFKGEKWGGLWKLYQTCDYALSQGLRRLHQSIVTNCVTCLPGCCQLFRVCEESCGDHIMLDRFGYHPTPTDDIVKQIRANASEDGNHVCHMLSAYSHAGWKTRQAIRARAFTDVPQSWSVFLSQRRRWSLGTTANELLLIRESGIHWFERIIAFSNCLTWLLSISIAVAATSFYIRGVAPRWISYALLGIVLTRVVYYILMVFWFPRTSRERKQYLLGLFGYLIVGRLVSALILLYAMYYIDSFGWGKTRKVVSEASAPSGDLEPIRDEEASLGMEKRTQPTTEVLDLQGDSSSSSS